LEESVRPPEAQAGSLLFFMERYEMIKDDDDDEDACGGCIKVR
jgi:hypothetical protein